MSKLRRHSFLPLLMTCCLLILSGSGFCRPYVRGQTTGFPLRNTRFSAALLYEPPQPEALNPATDRIINACAAELVGAALGLAVALSATAVAMHLVVRNYDDIDLAMGPVLFTGLVSYLITTPFLSSAGVHLTGKVCRQNGSYWNGVAGGAIGTLAGIAGMYAVSTIQSKHGHVTTTTLLIPLLIGPAFGSLIGYNLK